MKRLLALLGALIMILVAVLIRGAIDGEGPFSDTKKGNNPSSGLPRIQCAEELAAICEPLADEGLARITLADPGRTLDELVDAGTKPKFDVWLVVGPWDQILADNLKFASRNHQNSTGPLFDDTGTVLARSPVVFVTMDSSATEKATKVCPEVVAVGCASTDQSLRIGTASPRRGDGLVALGQAVSSRLGTSAFDTNTLDDPTPGADGLTLSAWISGLAQTSRKAGLGKNTPLSVALTKKGQFDAVTALESEASELLDSRKETRIFYPQPAAVAEVHLIPRAGVQLDKRLGTRLIKRIKDELSSAAWRVDGGRPVGNGTLPTIPPTDGLPDPGVLQVLRNIWGSGG